MKRWNADGLSFLKQAVYWLHLLRLFILLESLLSANIIKTSLGFMFFWTYLLCLPCFCLPLWLKHSCHSFPSISEIAFFGSHFLTRKLSFILNCVFLFFPLPTPSPRPSGWCQRWHLQCRWPPCTDLIHCPSCRFLEYPDLASSSLLWLIVTRYSFVWKRDLASPRYGLLG